MTLLNPIARQPMLSGTQIAGELAGFISLATVICRDESLAKHTTLRVGGRADVFIEPATETDLAGVVTYCRRRSLPFFVIGRGSNLLVRDGGFRGVIISLAHASFRRVEIVGERLHCGAGAKLKNVAVEAKRNGLSGVEFLEGIPGSVGGALRMNAGAMGGTTFEVVESARLMDLEGVVRTWTAREMAAQYRNCETLKTHIALVAVFRCRPAPREEIEKRMQEYSEKRWASQPAAPSAGCLFKNPAAIPAGKLIDELGLKGTRVGGAVVSAAHGNFIVNDGDATARDILELIALLQARARAERGIELLTEVEIIGEE
jgi:UDP-N-acetylmuramate--alanine ligase